MSIPDDRQIRIEDWLHKQRPDLASMYRAARGLLAGNAKPGDERTRVSHICHSMREVMNRLPTALGIAGAESAGRPSQDHVRKLAEVAAQFPNVDLVQDIENVPVPQRLASLLNDLIKAAMAEDRRRRADVAALLTDDGDTEHPAVIEWTRLSRFFVKWTHLQNEQSDAHSIPSDDELRLRIELAEALMDGIRAEFFENLHAIEDLLTEANQIVEGGDNDG